MKLFSVAKSVFLLPERVIRLGLNQLARLLPRSRPTEFGLREALLFGGRLDTYERYAPIVDGILREGEGLRVLDVGAGGTGLGGFLNGFPRHDRVFVLDRFPARHLARLVRGAPVTGIVADACRLPFRSGAFDVAVAADSLEHIERPRRADYCGELRRVAKRRVILHCPVNGGNGLFAGQVSDQRFMRWFRAVFRHDEANIAEHFTYGIPTVEELKELFPGGTVHGRQNTQVWLRCMQLERIPYLRVFAGFIYLFLLRPRNYRPPFYGAVVDWTAPAALGD